MNRSSNPKRQPDPAGLIALVTEMVAYWKEITRRNFIIAYPDGDPSEFEQRWPKILDNFFLVETVRAARDRLRHP